MRFLMIAGIGGMAVATAVLWIPPWWEGAMPDEEDPSEVGLAKFTSEMPIEPADHVEDPGVEELVEQLEASFA
jgi:hypothetical protein